MILTFTVSSNESQVLKLITRLDLLRIFLQLHDYHAIIHRCVTAVKYGCKDIKSKIKIRLSYRAVVTSNF